MDPNRRASRRPRPSLLLDRLLAWAAPAVAQRHRPARVIRSLDLGDAAAYRHDRRALHDPARGTFWLNECRELEVRTQFAANAVANFGFKSGIRIIKLPVSLRFRSSHQRSPRGFANF